MINTIYVNGCSWSAGDEINTDDKFKNYLKNRSYKKSINCGNPKCF